MENFALIKIDAPSEEDDEAWHIAMGTRPFVGNKVRGLEQIGPLFRGKHIVAAVSTEFVLEIVCRVLTQARVPYSIERGKRIMRRAKQCGTSTQSSLTQVALTLDQVSDLSSDYESTTPGSVYQREETDGTAS